MDKPQSKSDLLALLIENRQNFNQVIANIPPERMEETLPGGTWNAKDNLTHMTFYEQQLAERLWEVLENRPHTYLDTDSLTWQEQNPLIRERHKDDPISEVLQASQAAFQRLLAAVEALPETYLFEPQYWEGVAQPVMLWEVLADDIYDHYGEHIEYINRLFSQG